MAIVYPNTKNFDELTAEGFWIADYYTDHCGPCKLLDVVLNSIVQENPEINWAKCNMEPDNWDFMELHQVMGTPTLRFLLDGEEKGRMIGGFHSKDEVLAEISRCMYGE